MKILESLRRLFRREPVQEAVPVLPPVPRETSMWEVQKEDALARWALHRKRVEARQILARAKARQP